MKLSQLNSILPSAVDSEDKMYLIHKVQTTEPEAEEEFEDKKIDIGNLAEATPYDNTNSGLTADNVKDALDELAAGGREVLNDLTDVTITNPAANQLLQYNSTTEQWENKKYIEGTGNVVTGTDAHVEGNSSTASGNYAHAEGYGTVSSSRATHAEGYQTQATLFDAHAEGRSTQATGECSHSEGGSTTASGWGSHAEGYLSVASHPQSHAEGYDTRASNYQTHAEGLRTIASGSNSHAEGSFTLASGFAAHAEGLGLYEEGSSSNERSTASGVASHVEGYHTMATAQYAHAEGLESKAIGQASHAEGNGGQATGEFSHIEGLHYSGGLEALGQASHAEGAGTVSIGRASHAEGGGCKSYGYESHAEGSGTVANGNSSHAEGAGNTVYANLSHIEGSGNYNIFLAENSHVEGAGNVTYGEKSHIEGAGNTGSGSMIHIEGAGNYIRGEKSHAEGGGHNYFGYASHIEGKHNTGVGSVNHIEGVNHNVGIATLPSQFTPSATYAVDDIVVTNASYLNGYSEYVGYVYKCITAPGTIQTRQGLEIVTPSEWDASVAYPAKSVVKHNGCYYYTVGGTTAGQSPAPTLSPFGGGWNRLTRILSPFCDTTVNINTYTTAEFFLLNCNGELINLPNGEIGTCGSSNVAIVTESMTINAMWEPVDVGNYNHVEGQANRVLGDCCHVESTGNTANSNYAHVEGVGNTANSNYVHVEGAGNIASSEYQHVGGKNNIEDNQNTYIEIIGNGTYDTSVTPAVLTRSNARTLDWSGNEMIAGDLTFMGNRSLNTILPAPPAADGTYTLQCTVLNGVATYAWV